MLIVDFDKDHYQEWFADSIQSANKCIDNSTATWININLSYEAKLVDEVSEYFGLSKLVAYKLDDPHSAPQFLCYPEYVYLALFNLKFDLSEFTLDSNRICCILGKDILLTFQENSGSLFSPIRLKIKESTGRVRRMQIDYLLYLLLDATLDSTLEQFDMVADRMVTLENSSTVQRREIDEQIYQLKILLLQSREYIHPLYHAIHALQKCSEYIQPSVVNYYKDLMLKAKKLEASLESQVDRLTNLQLFRARILN